MKEPEGSFIIQDYTMKILWLRLTIFMEFIELRMKVTVNTGSGRGGLDPESRANFS